MTNRINKYYTKNETKLTTDEQEEYEKIKEKIIQQKVNDENTEINLDDIKRITKEEKYNSQISKQLLNDLNGYGKIDNLIHDDNLEEIMIIGSNKPVYVYHRQNGMMITELKLNENEIRQLINKIAGFVHRKIDQQTPILDARLKDGSRVNATLPPITADGPTITIRKFNKDQMTIFDLIKTNTISANLAAFLWIAIDGLNIIPSNLIISGGTGSGKTTTLNTLTTFIPENERIITIEDTLELQLPHNHIIRTETRPPNIEEKGEINMDVLLKNSLRQRPDRIIVGEVRSKEAITLFNALNTGHSGMGTLHANSSQDTINRLTNPPMNVPNIMMNSIDFIIMQKRFNHPEKGVIRRITEVAEVVGMEKDKPQLNKIFEYDYVSDKISYSAVSSNAINEIASMKGISNHEILEEIKRREKYLIKNCKKEVLDIHESKKIISKYYND